MSGKVDRTKPYVLKRLVLGRWVEVELHGSRRAADSAFDAMCRRRYAKASRVALELRGEPLRSVKLARVS